MSFGYSVSDFIAVLRLANDVRKRFVDAPGQFTAISEDVKALSNVIRDIDDVLPQRDLTSQQKTELDEIAQAGHNILKDLNQTLDKYQEIGPDAKSLSGKSRRVWKRLQWDQKEIDQYQNRITLNVSALEIWLIQCSNVSFEIKASVDRLNKRQDNRERREEHQAILNWLTPIDYATQQGDFINRRQEGTGQWLLDSDEFQEWLKQRGRRMFCPGIPGAGKTILTSIVVDYLRSKYESDASVGIAYLYCNFRRQHEQKPGDLLASLLKQLVQKKSSLPEDLKSLYQRHKDKKTRPSINELSGALQSVVVGLSRTFILIDALDECQASYQERDRLLSVGFTPQAEAHINLFATSRPVPEFNIHFEGCLSKDIRARYNDVLSYVNGRMSNLRRPRISKYPDLQDAIRREVVKAADGMFLLAKLHMDSLLSKSTPGDIEDALKDLPRGAEGLNTMYEDAMERINNQTEGSQALANRVLYWITHAKRALASVELQHALAVRDGAVGLNEKFVPEVEDMVSDCAGLVTVDEESGIIRLVHHTTQEYLERTQKRWFPDAETLVPRRRNGHCHDLRYVSILRRLRKWFLSYRRRV
ncbi:hypothetical protein K469DRAFT_756296 [Zopfia rhizophila CBS 207.26]|uniref:NACHT domain-containing protein n=1 Tax=Zopfia rhizophila CBS 207.26 TaxID=1314779 RepID=A0A6A6D7G3_9PEZI|nr:hypothetical protein K469DRAFT_756296 [Zopfia rhizophila CBS 207.26]